MFTVLLIDTKLNMQQLNSILQSIKLDYYASNLSPIPQVSHWSLSKI